MTEKIQSDNEDPKNSKDSEKDPEKTLSREDSEKLARRAFFREGFRNIMKPLAHIVESRLDHVRESFENSNRAIEQAGQSSINRSASKYPRNSDRLLRPPGALEEELFVDRCSRSGQCVSACPVKAILVVESDDPELNGTPYIDPQVQACVVCDDLACMQVCPTGALQKVPRHLIHMGVAEVHQDTCLRTDGEDCQICVEKCPLSTAAIHIPFSGAEVEVKTDGCVGCGVCEMYCPTAPRAIMVQ